MTDPVRPEPPARRSLDDLSVDPSALEGNPFDRHARKGSTLRRLSPRAWTAAALAVGVLLFGWHMQPSGTSPALDQPAVPNGGVVRLAAVDPQALRKQIVEDLRAAGVQASGYEQLGVQGVDADLPRPVPPAAQRVLERHRIPAPPDGALRIEISSR